MAGKRKTNPAGSTNNLRGDVLRVLGVLKVATVEQIQQISAPHMSYRHTDKAKPSERKQARTASHLGALSDLRKHGLVENGGRTSGGDTLRNLTPMGLKAASYELGRPVGEMGGPARGAGRSGASHPMAVNDALFALMRPKPDPALLDGEPAEALAAAQAAVGFTAGSHQRLLVTAGNAPSAAKDLSLNSGSAPVLASGRLVCWSARSK
ncbi:hypothetical protein [Streptomyces sp. NPDC001816]|uniref:hypothetical protein n=1 Tax=Streptomyces sp. NPDC001816 TaxID=3364612 RepID=UPI00368181FE